MTLIERQKIFLAAERVHDSFLDAYKDAYRDDARGTDLGFANDFHIAGIKNLEKLVDLIGYKLEPKA